MVILVDPPTWPAGGMTWSHLVSDTSADELHDFAIRLGLPRRAFDLDHYDLPAHRYDDAVTLGAHPVERRDLIRRLASSGLRIRGRDRCAAKVTVLLRDWEVLLPGAGDVGLELGKRWSEPHRTYHGLDHLRGVLDALDVLVGADRGGTPPSGRTASRWACEHRLAALALWFHDAIHDGKPDDEDASAVLAIGLLGPYVPAADVAEVARLVRLTATHDPGPRDRMGALVCDADLAILASGRHRYDRYVRQVRAEYAHVPDEQFRLGRSAVLRGLLGVGEIFTTPYAREHWSARANANVTAELSMLEAAVG